MLPSGTARMGLWFAHAADYDPPLSSPSVRGLGRQEDSVLRPQRSQHGSTLEQSARAHRGIPPNFDSRLDSIQLPVSAMARLPHLGEVSPIAWNHQYNAASTVASISDRRRRSETAATAPHGGQGRKGAAEHPQNSTFECL